MGTTVTRNTDLTPQEAQRRRGLIDAALNDPHATWTLDDFLLVAGVAENTAKVWPIRDSTFPKHVGTYRTEGQHGRARKKYPAGEMLGWLLRTERIDAETWEPQTPRTGGSKASLKSAAMTRRTTAPYTPDLTWEQDQRRRELIEEALHDRQAAWDETDIMLVDDVDQQTVRAWPNRGIGFPAPVGEQDNPGGRRPLDVYNAHAVLLWLLRTERLIPGSWQVSKVPAGNIRTPERAAYKARPPQLPAVIARVLKAKLGLHRGRDNDFIVRSRVDADNVRRYQILPSDVHAARRILDQAAEVEMAMARAGQPVRITRTHEWEDPDAVESANCSACGVRVDFGPDRYTVTDRRGEKTTVTLAGRIPPCTAIERPLDVIPVVAEPVPAAA